MKSWRTTTAAVIGAGIAVANGVQEWLSQGTVSNFPEILSLVTVAAGLLFARDNKVSSEDAGIR